MPAAVPGACPLPFWGAAPCCRVLTVPSGRPFAAHGAGASPPPRRPPATPRRLRPPRRRPRPRGPAHSPFGALPPAAGCLPSRLAVVLLPTVRGRPHRPAGRRPPPGGCGRRGAGRAPWGLPPRLLGQCPSLCPPTVPSVVLGCFSWHRRASTGPPIAAAPQRYSSRLLDAPHVSSTRTLLSLWLLSPRRS